MSNEFRLRVCAAALTVLAAGPARAFEPLPPPDKVLQLLQPGSGSFLGLGVVEIDAERAKALSLKEERGVEITRVDDDSPAVKGGLKVGDVVLEFNGQRVEGTEQFVRLVRETPVGREVKLAISRSGSLQTLAVKTGSRKLWTSRLGEGFRQEPPGFDFPAPPPGFNFPAPPDIPRSSITWRNSQIGLEAESLNSQLAEFFGVKEGVLVRSVVKGSLADKAGLKAGDVIVKVNDRSVGTPREISSAVRAARERKSIPVTYVREKRESLTNLPLDPDKAESERPQRAVRVRGRDF